MSSLFDLTVRLNASTVGFTSAIAVAVKALQGMQVEAGRTQSIVQNALAQRTSSYTAAQRATTNLDSAQRRYNSALQDHLRISSQYGASSSQAAKSLDRLAISHNNLANAQLGQATAANRAANAHASYLAASTAAQAAAAREDRMTTGMNQLAVGGLLTGVGAGIWSVLGGAIKSALSLNTVQTTIGQALTDRSGRRLSTVARTAALARLGGQEIDLGLRNQMSQTDVAGIVLSAVRSGMTRMDILPRILPGLANFSEVLKATRGYSPTQSATTATQFAHLFGAWSPAMFNSMTNLLGRALFVSPASPQEFLTLISQFSGATRGLYGKGAANQSRFLTDTVRTGLLLTEMGQETRGGTQLAQMVTRLLGTGRGRSRNALQQLRAASGVDFFNAHGDFTGIPAVVKALFTAYQKESAGAFGRQMHDAFGQIGVRIAGNLAQLSTSDRLKVLTTMLGPNGLPQTSAIQKAINQSPQGQINQLTANMSTLDTVIGTQLLPSLAPFISGVTGAAKTLVEIAKAHPTLVRLTGQFAALSGSLLLVIGPMTAVAGIFNILFASTKNAVTLFGLLKTALGPLVGAGASLGLAGIATTISIIGSFGVALYGLYKTLKFMGDFFGSGGHPNVGATVKAGGLTYGRDTVLGDPRYGSWIPITKPPAGYHWGAHVQQFVPNRPTPPRDPRGRTYGVGGGTRTPPTHNWHITVNGYDHETRTALLDDLMKRISQNLDFDENYDGLGIHSLAPGPMGY